MGNVWATTLTAAIRVDRDSAGRLGRVTQEMAGLVSNQTDFAYNPALQIVSRSTSNDAYVWSPPHAVDRAYQANGLNQYAVVADAGAAASAYTYDANGNLTSNGTRAFVYDSENRLVSARGARNADLSYDPLGRLWRLADPIAGTATRFFYDGDRLVFETSDTGVPRHFYVHGNDPDQPLVWWDLTGSNNRRFLHSDHQGSIVAVSRGENGTAFAINSYDPWGVPGANNAPTLRFGYTGQAWLPELGMYYYKARIYYPALGRFLQTDPVGYADQVNLYAYVGNDPTNHADVTGLCETRTGSNICEATTTKYLSEKHGDERVIYSVTYAKSDGFVFSIGKFASEGAGDSDSDVVLGGVAKIGVALSRALVAGIIGAGSRAAGTEIGTVVGIASGKASFTAAEHAGLTGMMGSGEGGAKVFLARVLSGEIKSLPAGITRETLERYVINLAITGKKALDAPSQQMRIQGIIKLLERVGE